MPANCVMSHREGAVLTLTLNRPEKLNALDYPMIEDLLDLLKDATSDDTVRALVLAGAGRAFCSGDDISGEKDRGTVRPGERSPIGMHHRQQAIVRALAEFPKPAIARLQGHVHGMGSDIALACDFRVAASDAILGDIRMSRGMPPGSGATWLLPRIVGFPKAQEIILLGKPVSASEALAIGLVTKVVPSEGLVAETAAFADELAAGPTKSFGIAKDALYRHPTMTLPEAQRDMLGYAEAAWRPEDEVEGVQSFRERRAPRYSGQ